MKDEKPLMSTDTINYERREITRKMNRSSSCILLRKSAPFRSYLLRTHNKTISAHQCYQWLEMVFI